MKVMLNTIKI